jgi:hypothetical protein
MDLKNIRLDRPAPLPFRLRAWLRRSPLGRAYYRYRWNQTDAVFLISFPKAGRTWLRLLVGKMLAGHFNLDAEVDDMMALDHLASLDSRVPLVQPRHDDYPQLKTPDEIVTDKSEYAESRIIFLTRDIRDLAVSAYFQMTKRRHKFSGSISDFLCCPRGSVETMIRFHNIWADQKDVPAGFLHVRYEDLHADAPAQLARIAEFLHIAPVSNEVIREAIEFASFSNMRKMEVDGSGKVNRLDGGQANDPESLKTRKGKVGGFVDYLEEDDIQRLNRKLVEELDPMYGYPYEPEK